LPQPVTVSSTAAAIAGSQRNFTFIVFLPEYGGLGPASEDDSCDDQPLCSFDCAAAAMPEGRKRSAEF
jgi:hypothetical protein